MIYIEFGTCFISTDGQNRVVVDVGDDKPEVSFETLGIFSLEPLLISYMSSSAAPYYIAKFLDRVLSVDEVVTGILNSNHEIHESYEKMLRSYASSGKIRTISF